MNTTPTPNLKAIQRPRIGSDTDAGLSGAKAHTSNVLVHLKLKLN